jgi:hypothetical protein
MDILSGVSSAANAGLRERANREVICTMSERGRAERKFPVRRE